MQKGFYFLLTVLLVLSLSAVPALAATTVTDDAEAQFSDIVDESADENAEEASDGQEEDPEALYGTEAALKDSIDYHAGVTTISWDDIGSGAASYRIYLKVIDNGIVENTQWFLGDTKELFFETTECLPGKSYSVVLTDEERYILDSKTYTLPEAPDFKDGKLTTAGIKVSVEPRKMVMDGNPSKDTKKVNALKASEIKEGLDSQTMLHGVKYTMKMPQLAKPRSFFVTLAFESPDGYLYVEDAEEITFDRVNNGYQTIWWNITGVNFFNELNEAFGEIPTGTYTIYLYWDGMHVNTSTFEVQ